MCTANAVRREVTVGGLPAYRVLTRTDGDEHR
jgi:hypothetical protein